MAEDFRSPLLVRKVALSWRRALRRLIPFGGVTRGNKLWFTHEGDEAFSAIHFAISNAQKSIYLETYTWAPDRVGLWIRDALILAAERGVKVTVLYDHVGSSALRQNFLAPMRSAGIEVLPFNPIWPWRRHGPLLFRDHRKIIVIDKKIAFCGSMNISEDYAGPILGNDRFRDSLVQVEGPAVRDLLEITLESIFESQFSKGLVAAKKKLLALPPMRQIYKRLFRAKADLLQAGTKDTVVQVLSSNTRQNLTHIQKSMEECLNGAMDYCYLTTPYFLPYGPLRTAIIDAKKRGVDVRILVAGLSDVPLMHWAMQHVYSRFLKEGVRIYEMNKKTLHAKLSTIDGIYASIGSYNLDHWSARRNLEATISIIDRPIALSLREQFYQDLKLSKEIEFDRMNSRSLLNRFFCWICYQLFRL